MLKCGRCFATYHFGMIWAIIQVGPMGNRTWDPRRTKPACWPLHCRDRQRESPKPKIKITYCHICTFGLPKTYHNGRPQWHRFRYHATLKCGAFPLPIRTVQWLAYRSGTPLNPVPFPWVQPELWLRSSPNDESQSNVQTLTSTSFMKVLRNSSPKQRMCWFLWWRGRSLPSW